MAIELEDAEGTIPLFSDDDIAIVSETDEEEEAKEEPLQPAVRVRGGLRNGRGRRQATTTVAA